MCCVVVNCYCLIIGWSGVVGCICNLNCICLVIVGVFIDCVVVIFNVEYK